MIGALLYLQFHSLKNRTVRRILRLRQPKYLFGAIVGAAYFYLYFGRFIFGRAGGRGAAAPWASSSSTHELIEAGAALLFVTLVVMAWLLPGKGAVLHFTEAEVAFLFPAPITRRRLIHYYLLRIQLGILFSSLILPLILRRWGGGHFWFHAVGWWIIFCTLSLHGTATAFARARLLDRGITPARRRLVVLGLVVAGVTLTALWMRRSAPGLTGEALASGEGARDYLERVVASGPLPWLLLPGRLVTGPFLAADLAAFGKSLIPAFALLGLLYLWVVRTAVAFEEASADAAAKLAARVAAIRAGNAGAGTRRKVKSRPAPFKLRPTGPPAFAFLWKNLISAGQMFNLRLWILLMVGAGSICYVASRTMAGGGFLPFLSMMTGMVLCWSFMLGPQILRQDFRQDLRQADVLKTYPVPSWQLALGQLAGPVAILTAVQWVLLLVGAILASHIEQVGVGTPFVISAAVNAAIVIPPLNLLLFLVPNGAVLLFPGWVLSSATGPAAMEAMGQRLIFFFGQMLAVIVALLPAGGLSAGIFLLCHKLLSLSPAWSLVPAALAAAAVLVVEGGFGIFLLAKAFDKLDVAAETTP